MPSSERKSTEREKSTEKAAASLSKTEDYALFYGSNRVEKDFAKCFDRIPAHDVEAIKKAIKELRRDPRQKSRKLHNIEISTSLGVAEHRLRVGDYRILYDVDDVQKRVVLLKLARRNERTYR